MRKKNYLIFYLLFLYAYHYGFSQAEIYADTLDFSIKKYEEGKLFTAIAYDQNTKRVWAGTDQEGLYYTNTEDSDAINFLKLQAGGTNLDDYRIMSIASDKLGNTWVGHSGINFSESGGGMELINKNLELKHLSGDRNARGFNFFQRDGLATRDVVSVTTDINNTVWVAQRSSNLTSGSTFVLTPGAISYKFAQSSLFVSKSTWEDYRSGNESPELPYPAWTYNTPPTKTPQSRNMQGISADSTSVWTAVYPYVPFNEEEADVPVRLPSRVLVYNLEGRYTDTFTFEDIGFAFGGVFNGICANDKKGTWVSTSFSGKGFAVYKDGSWTVLDSTSFPLIIPSDTRFNTNGIWKNEYGNVFMGTNNGLIVYDGRGAVDDQSSYTLYTKTSLIEESPYQVINPNIISNNILTGVSEKNNIQWMGTDSGIMRFKLGISEPLANIPYWKTAVFARKRSLGAKMNTEEPTQDNYVPVVSENPAILAVENAIKNKDKTYHFYEIETKICDSSDPNSPNREHCTLERIYEMMRKNVKYQAIIPDDFPKEVLGTEFLEDITNEHVKVYEQLASDQEDFIPSIGDLMKQSPILADYDVDDSDIKTGFGRLLTSKYFEARVIKRGYPDYGVFPPKVEIPKTREEFTELQKQNANESVHESEKYLLYNNPETARTRKIFKDLYGVAMDMEECVGPGIENILYDPVIMHIDETNYRIINFTIEGHYFHPGKISRILYRRNDGAIMVKTFGEGLHFCKGELGFTSGKLNTIMGVTLFKNVDIRFREGFKELKF